jgi:hypothetical protein
MQRVARIASLVGYTAALAAMSVMAGLVAANCVALGRW